MSSDKSKQLATLWAVLIALLIAGAGIGLLFLAALWQVLIDHPGTQSVVRSFAGFLIASVAIAFLWQFHGKRAFLNEIMTQARLSEDIRRAGVVGVGMDYLGDVKWYEMFRSVKELDIVFAYGSTWRRHNLNQLRDLASKRDSRVRVVLPNPDNEALVACMAAQFGLEPIALRTRILDAKREFDLTFGNSEGEYGVWFLNDHPAFSYYRLDDQSVVTFYSNRRPYEKPPFLKVENGGLFDEFFREEFRFLLFGNLDKNQRPPTQKVTSEHLTQSSQ
jgi:hypothetical protein